jgi:signal transduction histidine kinase
LQNRTQFKAIAGAFWGRIVLQSDPKLKLGMTAVTCGILALIGLADFLVGFEASLLGLYLIPIALAVVARGWRFGLAVAVGSVAIWMAGDLAAGAHFASPLVPIWNVVAALLTYFVLIGLLSGLLALQRDLQKRVLHRTAALVKEIAERERLEKAVLEISERERRSIGHDLHDGLGQHLTGTALSGQLIVEKLQERGAEEVIEMKRMVALVKAAIEQTRQMAKGLLLADIDAEGLASALQEFCVSTAAQFRVECHFDGEVRIDLTENGIATHLYRIAQEAVRNAIRHGRARRVTVRLKIAHDQLILSVRDNGGGLPSPSARVAGMGLQIMEHRARLIGAAFTIEAPPEGGTLVVCTLPLRAP